MGRLWVSPARLATSVHQVNVPARKRSAFVESAAEIACHSVTVDYKPYSEMPGPQPLPIIGNSWRFLPVVGQYQLGQLDVAMKDLHRKYGRIAKISDLYGHPDLVFVFDPDLIEQVFRAEDTLPCRPSMPSIHFYKQSLRKEFFRDSPGVIGIHGELWDQFRGKVNQVMLTAKAAKCYAEDLDTVAREFVNRCRSLVDERNELPENFLTELYKWSLESLGVFALDTRLHCLRPTGTHSVQTKRILDAVRTFFEMVAVVELRKPYSRLLGTRDWRHFVGALDVFREECMQSVDAAIAGCSGPDGGGGRGVLHKVLERTGDRRVAAVLGMDLMLVGLDTSSASAATVLYLLSRNKAAQERLFEELQGILPSTEHPLTAGSLDQMQYLRACIKEAMRMFPVIIGNGRSLSKDTVVGGFMVPKGTHIIFPHLVTGNDEENGFYQPEKFLPERWMLSERAASPRTHPFASLPFGFGRRMCLGRRFAELQLQILLARMIRSFRVEYNYGDFRYEVSPVYIPTNPLKFQLIPR